MGIALRVLAAASAIVAASLLAAPAAMAESKDHASSNMPWLIGLAVIVALGLLFLMLRLRRGVTRDGDSNFQQPD
jgi:ABC-type Na+ efflux pump permease subunit